MRARYMGGAAIACALLIMVAGFSVERPAVRARVAADAYYRLPFGTRVLRLGDRGSDVKTLNWALRSEALNAPYLDSFNRRIAPGRRGLQSVQTQAVCAGAGGRGMKVTVGELLRQYKRANFKRTRVGRVKGPRFRYRREKRKIHSTNLSIEVSFSYRPQPWSSMALLRTSPQRASKCTRAALKRGAGAILYWASPDSMRALLSIPRMCALRPAPVC